MNFAAAALAFALAPFAPEAHHDHGPELGKVTFQTSCNSNANARFQQALGWLHSFEYAQAAQTFSEAAGLDPRCAVAHWGVAMSYYHPLWAPPSASELEKGSKALVAAANAGVASDRERAYIAALGTFYRDSDSVDHKTRALAYSAAMGRVHDRFPQDREASVFYALSLIAAGAMDKDPIFTKEKQAAVILTQILTLEPNHPGAAHYLIHNFDYPPLAQLALPAARRYANIAPTSPHAQHMPSHIFVRLGLWDEAIKSNQASEAASRALAKAQGLVGSSSERLHAMDYLAYSYLQTGQDVEAERVMAELNSIQRADPPIFTVAYAATAIPARLALERRQWKKAALLELSANVRSLAPLAEFKWAEAHVYFARAVGAARSGNAKAARAEVAQLQLIEDSIVIPAGSYDWRTQVAIERQVAQAWLSKAEGRAEDAVRQLRAAADLDDATDKHPVTPGALLPAREQLGDLLLELRRPAAALSEYEASLKRAPRRLAGLYGAARASKLADNSAEAHGYYLQIVELTKKSDGTRVEVKEARAVANARKWR